MSKVRRNWTVEEDEILLKLYSLHGTFNKCLLLLGPNWNMIASKMGDTRVGK